MRTVHLAWVVALVVGVGACDPDPAVMMEPVCGDGMREGSEACDDGNTDDGDGCSAACVVEPNECGDGRMLAGEACDDGNVVDGDGCDGDCTETACGNGRVTDGEECDDNNLVAGDGCDELCVVEPPPCGDGDLDFGEQCDDGNLVAGDGCDADCDIEPDVCGDGTVGETEACDDGNLADADGCDSNCTATACGNGIRTAGEVCDDGNAVNGDGCDTNCTPSGCGNGARAPTEECDDGNGFDGDGCNIFCRFEENVVETELNDTIATADDFATHSILGHTDGAIGIPGDVDYFSIDVVGASGGTLTATVVDSVAGDLCGPRGELDSQLTFFDPEGGEVFSSEDLDMVTNWCSGGTIEVYPGRWTVRVRPSPFLPPATTFSYRLEAAFVPGACGDSMVTGTEACDDGNTIAGDGCSFCVIETPEGEPNDDGMLAVGTDDFSAAAAAGPLFGDAWIAGSISPAGDDDGFVIENTIGAPVGLVLETFGSGGVGTCELIDTELQVRDGGGSVFRADDDGGVETCSRVEYFLPIGQTIYVHVREKGDNAEIPEYFLSVRFLFVFCGDGLVRDDEQCDDGNVFSGDGCSGSCLTEVPETEPNDDGAVAIATNDFSVAAADGPYETDAFVVAQIMPAGDDDVYAVANPGLAAVTLTAETFGPGGVGVCGIDTVLTVRDGTGASLVSDDDAGIGFCSRVEGVVIEPGATVYVHIIDRGDNSLIGLYYLQLLVS